MKLISINNGTKDGQLAVLSRDMQIAHLANHIVPSLRIALDDWPFFVQQLQVLSEEVNAGQSRYPFPFDSRQCLAPLPRTFHAQSVHVVTQADAKQRWPDISLLTSDGYLSATDALKLPSFAKGVYSAPSLIWVATERQQSLRSDQVLWGFAMQHEVLLPEGDVTQKILPFGMTQAPILMTVDELFTENAAAINNNEHVLRYYFSLQASLFEPDAAFSLAYCLKTADIQDLKSTHLNIPLAPYVAQPGNVYCLNLRGAFSDKVAAKMHYLDSSHLYVPGERIMAQCYRTNAEQTCASVFGAIDQAIYTMAS